MTGLEELALRFTEAAAHVLWLGALVALGVFVIERAFVKSAAGRHAVHLAGLLVTLVALPVAFVVAPLGQPAVSSGLPVAQHQSPGGADDVVFEPRNAPVVGGEVADAPANQVTGEMMAADGTRAAAPGKAFETRGRWQMLAPWVTGGYAVGLVLMALRLCCGFAGSVRLRRRSEAVAAGAWTSAARRMAEAVGVKVRPALHWSREVAAPVVMGLVKPVILLPVALASRLSPAQVEAVLAHELAHLHRRDTWAVAVQRFVETVLFFHPAVWWMSRRMEAAREEACDDLVVAAGCDPADYAEALLICSECRLEQAGLSSRVATRLAATGKDGAPLRQRVLRLLGQGDRGAVRLGRVGWVLAALAIGGVALAVTVDGWGRDDLADFDFDDPPGSYEKGVKVADRDQRFKVEGITFQAGPLRWEKSGWQRLPQDEQGRGEELFLNLGTSGGYEVVEIRLFDHEPRELFHTSKWQLGEVKDPRYFVERIGSTNWLRMRETGGVFPNKLDVWLRIVTRDRGPMLVLPASEGGAAEVGGCEVVITRLMAGTMNGDGQAPTGEMRWDLSSVRDEDRALTLELQNRGKPLHGRYHLVAVKKDDSRHPMDHIHFIDFPKLLGRQTYVHMDVALEEVDHFELVPFRDRHKFFFNGLEMPRAKLPELGRRDRERIEEWVAAVTAGKLSEEDFVLRVQEVGPQAVRALIPLMRSGKTDVLALKGIGQFVGDPAVVSHLAGVLRDLSTEPEHISPNTRHCCLVLLGDAGDRGHVDLAAGFLESRAIAAIYALEKMGGERARDHLLAAFDRVPTDQWWMLAQALGRLGDPVAVPELKRRLAMVELPPSERFPRATVEAFTNAIAELSESQEGPTWHAWSQAQHFRYPFDGPGTLKTFSVDPPQDHHVRLPAVDPATESGRAAIWEAMEEATEGAGFTLDGDEAVLFHGLRAMPLWEDGIPYPVSLHDWLRETSHRELLERAQREARADRVKVPESELLLAMDPRKRLYVLKLEKQSPEFEYVVALRPLDPLRQLIKAPAPERAFTEERVCTLHDFGSGAENGALNLHRAHMVHLKQEIADAPGPDAVLFAEFHRDGVGLGVGGAEEFRLVAIDGEIPAGELIETLRSAGGESTPGRRRIATPRGVFHAFEDLSPGQWFGFAARMPGGVPVGGLLEVSEVDWEAETLTLRHRFLNTDGARTVFGPPETAEAAGRELQLTFRRLDERVTDEVPFAGEWSVNVPEDLQDFRLALGVIEVDTDDDTMVRSQVGSGGSTLPLHKHRSIRFEVRRGENERDSRMLSWSLARETGDAESEKSIGFRADSWVIGREPLTVDHTARVRTDRFLPLARIHGDNRDLLLVGMLLAPNDDYEGLNASELREHWRDSRAETESDGVKIQLKSAHHVSSSPGRPHPILEFTYDARNTGSHVLHLPESGDYHQVEVDGTWYEWADPRLLEAGDDAEPVVSKGSRLLDFGPDESHLNQRIRLDATWRAIPDGEEGRYAQRQLSGYGMWAEDYGGGPALGPGKHLVRIAVLCPPARAGLYRMIRAVSEPLEIALPADAAGAARGPDEDAQGAVFRRIERFARLPEDEQERALPAFYAELSWQTLSPMVEHILSNHPHDILNPNQEGDQFDGNTRQWAGQLEEAAKELSVAEVADRLERPVWIRVAARARAMQVLERHPEITAKLAGADLGSKNQAAVERATAIIVSLQLRGFSERLLELWLADDECSQAAWSALVFLRDPAIFDLLRQRVEADPSFLVRCSGLFQGPLAGEEAAPFLLELLDSPDVEIRYHAAEALQECRDARLAEPAARMARDEESRFRIIAARLVGKLPEAGFADVRDDLVTLLRDESDEVRFITMHSFAGRKEPAAATVILEALKAEGVSEQHKVWVMQSLSALTGKTWNYNMHRWGPENPGNRDAIAGFEGWMNEQGRNTVRASSVRVHEADIYADGGTLYVKMSQDGGEPFEWCIDNREPMDGHEDLRGRVFVGAGHPSHVGARLLEAGSNEEKKLLADLRAWLEGNFSEEDAARIRAADVDDLEPAELMARRVLNALMVERAGQISGPEKQKPTD